MPQLASDQFADQRWRLNNLYWITDKDGKEVPFAMDGPQRELWDNLHYRNIILKARQLGFSRTRAPSWTFTGPCSLAWPKTSISSR